LHGDIYATSKLESMLNKEADRTLSGRVLASSVGGPGSNT